MPGLCLSCQQSLLKTHGIRFTRISSTPGTGRIRHQSTQTEAQSQSRDDRITSKCNEAKEINEGQDENIENALHRMRFDNNRLTYTGSSRTPIKLAPSAANIARMDRKTSERMRVAKAREQVAVHRSKRDFEKSKDYLAIEEAYRPTPSSLEGLQSLAEERIDEARRAGAFNNLEGKGKAIDFQELRNPMVDNTEFFLNQIIKRQGALPPFVDAQANLDRSIRAFRESIRNEWITFCCKLIALGGGSLESQVRRAEGYGRAEAEGKNRLRDQNWEKRESKFITARIEALNSSARGYNIIAPFASRRGYLNLRDELDGCYRDATPLVAQALIDRANAPRLRESSGYKMKYGRRSLMDDLLRRKMGVEGRFYERNEANYGFSAWFRDHFIRS